MHAAARPDAVDTRLVFRIYAVIVGGAGLLVYGWPLRALPDPWAQWLTTSLDLPDIPYGRLAMVRIVATIVAAFGMCAVAFAAIEDPWSRRRALFHFAILHVVAGMMFWLQWSEVLGDAVPSQPGFSPIAIGIVLLYFALTHHEAGLNQPLRTVITLLDPTPAATPVDRLRSQYEEQITRAARQEERERLARDLHDAVKQQLFVIQTSAATAEVRFDQDAPGARAALEQVRAAAREATTEMEAMLEQLQSPPLANTGLVDALKKQCDALRFRTGAEVTMTADALPPEWALPPGTAEALFRIAQEALSNVARHARARSVSVRLDVIAGRLAMTIHDDGAGFDPDQARGLGTVSMRTRAEAIQGAFELWSRRGGGTTVKVTLPYETTTPREFRNRALIWGAVAAAALAIFALKGEDTGFTGALLCVTIGGIGSTAQNALAYFRLRRRGAAAA